MQYQEPVITVYEKALLKTFLLPGQTQAYMSVGGGWDSASLNLEAVEYQEVFHEIRIAQIEIQINEETYV